MKKISILKVSVLLLFILAIGQSYANTTRKKGDFSRTYSDSYSINSDATLTLDCNFTDVEIINWDKNEILIEVEINVNAKSEKEAEKWFDKIMVDISGGPSNVKLKTSLNKNNNSITSNNNRWFVNATIHVPVSIQLDAAMEFGSLTSEIIAGVCDINMEFGNVDAQAFPNDNNKISIEYGNFTSKVLACKKASVEFGGIEIGILTSSCVISSEFSSLEIGQLDKFCRNVEINVEFGSLDLTLSEDSNYKIEASSSFGDIDLDKAINVHTKDKGMFDLYYSASIGSGNGKIDIDSSYSDIDIDVANSKNDK